MADGYDAIARRYSLARNVAGDCIYLGARGCTVYERRPRECREFDCRHYIGDPLLPDRIRREAKKRAHAAPEV